MNTYEEKIEKLHQIIKQGEKPVVAFSGGVDSSLLLYLAVTLRKGDALGILAVSSAQSDSEKEKAIAFCHDYHLPLETVTVDVLQKEEVAKNRKNRCYHCKTLILKAIKEKAEALDCGQFFDGSNADDEKEYRPGKRALAEADFLSPLALAGFTKTNVRNYACDFSLSNWNKPSKPCLLTRFPYDMEEEISEALLAKIEKGEEILNLLCKHNHRLRYENSNTLRIEVAKDDMETILSGRIGILEAMEKLGFDNVSLDLRPFKSGSFDRK